MGELSILAQEGAHKLTWDPDMPDQIIKAQEQFQLFLEKGYSAFHLSDAGGEGKKISMFDASAGKIVMVPKLGGG